MYYKFSIFIRRKFLLPYLYQPCNRASQLSSRATCQTIMFIKPTMLKQTETIKHLHLLKILRMRTYDQPEPRYCYLYAFPKSRYSVCSVIPFSQISELITPFFDIVHLSTQFILFLCLLQKGTISLLKHRDYHCIHAVNMYMCKL